MKTRRRMAPGCARRYEKRPAVSGQLWLGANMTMSATPAMTKLEPSRSRLRKGSPGEWVGLGSGLGLGLGLRLGLRLGLGLGYGRARPGRAN
eukprot:scaffold67277_cov45-Phaeocystis_antarctica.AAC.2